MALHIDIITIFPEMIMPVLAVGMTGRALARGVIVVEPIDLREHAPGKHRSTDDTPYGGGCGMVMRPEPIWRALRAIEEGRGRGHRVLLSPSGTPLDQRTVRRLSGLSHLVLLCGRYEGIDERVGAYMDEEISLGDFVLSGGELAALAIVDAVARLMDGVLHNEDSTRDESFEGSLLEYPHYTKPQVFDGAAVPEVLLSGNHERIRRWRRKQALLRTMRRRPDLFARHAQSAEDQALLREAEEEIP